MGRPHTLHPASPLNLWLAYTVVVLTTAGPNPGGEAVAPSPNPAVEAVAPNPSAAVEAEAAAGGPSPNAEAAVHREYIHPSGSTTACLGDIELGRKFL
jgi:hypothetical protein